MPFDWHENLELARFLRTLPDAGRGVSAEAALRCAIGRAYFAAYGYAYRYASLWLGFRPETREDARSQDHGRLKAHLRQARRQQVSRQLNYLRITCNRCDYDDAPFDARLDLEADAAIRAAEYIFEALPPPAAAPEGRP